MNSKEIIDFLKKWGDEYKTNRHGAATMAENTARRGIERYHGGIYTKRDLWEMFVNICNDQPYNLPDTNSYSDVLDPFIEMMRKELYANSDKGDRSGWLSMTNDEFILEVYYHVAKLQKAVRDGDQELVREHSADVANMAMMVADKFGLLLHDEFIDGSEEPLARSISHY